MKKEIVVTMGMIMAGVVVVLNFMPGSLTSGKEDLKIVGMCDSVFVNDDGDIEFCIRNKSDELFYIDRMEKKSDISMLKQNCSGQVITLVFHEPGLIAKALNDTHRITRVEQNQEIVYSSGKVMAIIPQ